MSRILITGGLGFVGGRLTKRLAENHEVIVSSRTIPAPEIRALHGDINFINHSDLLNVESFPEKCGMGHSSCSLK